jgi:hypothetical protein
MAPNTLRSAEGYPIPGREIPCKFSMPGPSEEQWAQHPKLSNQIWASYDELDSE